MSAPRIEPGAFVLANPGASARPPLSRQVRRSLDRALKRDGDFPDEGPVDWDRLIELAETMEGGEL